MSTRHPGGRTCRDAFPLMLVMFPFLLVRGMYREWKYGKVW